MKERHKTAVDQSAVTATCTRKCGSSRRYLVTTDTTQNKTFNKEMFVKNHQPFCSQLKSDFFQYSTPNRHHWIFQPWKPLLISYRFVVLVVKVGMFVG